MQHLASTVVFHVTDMPGSLEFYTQHLGFNIEFQGQPETYVGLKLGDLQLHLNSDPSYAANVGRGHITLQYDEVDALYRQLKDNDVGFYSDIDDRFYGMRDFSIKDPDGNRIGIGCSIVD